MTMLINACPFKNCSKLLSALPLCSSSCLSRCWNCLLRYPWLYQSGPIDWGLAIHYCICAVKTARENISLLLEYTEKISRKSLASGFEINEKIDERKLNPLTQAFERRKKKNCVGAAPTTFTAEIYSNYSNFCHDENCKEFHLDFT